MSEVGQVTDSYCNICRMGEKDYIEYGDFIEKKDVKVHYYCLLLSSNLPQRGEATSGILGFFLKDIKAESRSAALRVCVYCEKRYASIKCSKCVSYFHLICGMVNNCVFQFVDEFKSFCHKHHEIQRSAQHVPTEECLACNEVMGEFNPVTSIMASCCNLGWMHRRCMKQNALQAGYYLKCPWCGEKVFRENIKKEGIFVPDREAHWELEKGAYEDLHRGHYKCDAPTCICPKGRHFRGSNKWYLNKCNICAGSGVHNACAGIKILNDFVCKVCKKGVCLEEVDFTFDTSLYVSRSQEWFNTVENRLLKRKKYSSDSSEEESDTIFNNTKTTAYRSPGKCASFNSTLSANFPCNQSERGNFNELSREEGTCDIKSNVCSCKNDSQLYIAFDKKSGEMLGFIDGFPKNDPKFGPPYLNELEALHKDIIPLSNFEHYFDDVIDSVVAEWQQAGGKL